MGDVRYFLDASPIINTSGINEGCVEQLERLLQKAKDGEIVGIAGSVQYADGSTSGHRAGFLRTQAIVGALFCQATDMASEK